MCKCSYLCTPHIPALLACRGNNQNRFYRKSVCTLDTPIKCTGQLHILKDQYISCIGHYWDRSHRYTCCSHPSNILNTLKKFCCTLCNYRYWYKIQYCTSHSWTDRHTPYNYRPAKSSMQCTPQSLASCKNRCCMTVTSLGTQRTGSLFPRSRPRAKAASRTQ